MDLKKDNQLEMVEQKQGNEIQLQYVDQYREQHMPISHLQDQLFDDEQLYTVPDFSQEKQKAMKRLLIVAFISFLFMSAEIIFGYLSNSLAIMSDAAHILQDVIGFFISIFSICISKKPANAKMSYGYHRAEVVGALGSMIFIWGVTIWLVYESIERILNPEEIDGLMMFIIAILGFLFNLGQLKLLHSHNHGHSHGQSSHNHNDEENHSHSNNNEDHETKDKQIDNPQQKNDIEQNFQNNQDNNQVHQLENQNDKTKINNNINSKIQENKHQQEHNSNSINIQAALIHVLGDALQSVGVIIASLFLYIGGNQFAVADPICTLLFSIIVIFTTAPVTKDCIVILMEGSPIKIKMDQLKNKLMKIEGVLNIHDLHVWALSSDHLALSAHIISNNPSDTMKKATGVCKEFYIYHSTLQVENSNENNIYNSNKCAQNQQCHDSEQSLEKKK